MIIINNNIVHNIIKLNVKSINNKGTSIKFY